MDDADAVQLELLLWPVLVAEAASAVRYRSGVHPIRIEFAFT